MTGLDVWFSNGGEMNAAGNKSVTSTEPQSELRGHGHPGVDVRAAGVSWEGEFDREPVVQVDIASLSVAGSPRSGGESSEHVALLAGQEDLPPIVVHRPTMMVIDGLHRLKATQLRGERSIAVRFFDGDQTEAFVLAVRLNVKHGLPLTLADRKRAAERIMSVRPEWSDRRVASIAGISPATVSGIRRRVVGDRGTESRVGRDGRIRPVDGSLGRKLAGDLLAQDPTLSLRQVARLASISPETVRDVRNRLGRGESLQPQGRGDTVRLPADADGRSAVERPGDRVARGQLRAVPSIEGGRQRHLADPTVVVNGLKADPALRFTDAGRNLLRLLSLHLAWTEQWESIITHVPPHCSELVSGLARQFASQWTELAEQTQDGMANAG